jgi:hypothetical protein
MPHLLMPNRKHFVENALDISPNTLYEAQPHQVSDVSVPRFERALRH